MVMSAHRKSVHPQASDGLQHATINPISENSALPKVHEALPTPATFTEAAFGHDFSRVPLHAEAPAQRTSFCPLSPTRCPFGGACHTCSVPVQTKLKIGQPDDKYEREADRVADMVMSMPDSRLQRQVEPEEEEEEETIRPKQVGGRTPRHVPGLAAEARSLKGGGRPLPQSVRSFFEPRFGRDLSQVRVHTDARAAESAQMVNARAYTLGHDIVFGSGRFAPYSHQGKSLLAHELVHVVQQDGGRSAGVIQRAEVDDRSCMGLTDIESDIDTKVNSEIAAARTAAGTPIDVPALLRGVMTRLGGGAISPIEQFIESLPASKRRLPPSSLAGTKYSGVGAVNRFYYLHTLGLVHVVGSAAKINGICVGADKLGHFFQEGYSYFSIATAPGGSTAKAESAGRALEIGIQGLGATGVFSNADRAANKAGMQFYKDLQANPSGFTFNIKNYITTKWNEQSNPSFYASSEGRIIWSNLLTGPWKGPFTPGGSSTPIDSKVDLNATTTGSVSGKYEWPAVKPTNKGKIKNGTITQKTTSVSGTIPGEAPVSATPVTGVSIEFDWEEKKSTGKGKWDSVNEKTLDGTWGTGSSRTNGGTWKLKKV
jgi:hypothetical protein